MSINILQFSTKIIKFYLELSLEINLVAIRNKKFEFSKNNIRKLFVYIFYSLGIIYRKFKLQFIDFKKFKYCKLTKNSEQRHYKYILLPNNS